MTFKLENNNISIDPRIQGKENSIMAVKCINQYITYDLNWYQEKYTYISVTKWHREKTLHPGS